MTTGIRGAILAGGAASRFGGEPKGLERVRGIRILDRVADALGEAFGVPPLLVANAPEAPSWRPDLRVVADAVPEAGVLGGILTAILEAPAPVVAVAWDMPFVSPALLRRLAEGLGDADAVLPASGGRRGMEPLCAAYGPACGPAIRRALLAGDSRAIAFHPFVRVGIVGGAEVATFGDPAQLFFNINTPADLRRAEELAQG